jgi:hypothetical protein
VTSGLQYFSFKMILKVSYLRVVYPILQLSPTQAVGALTFADCGKSKQKHACATGPKEETNHRGNFICLIFIGISKVSANYK